MLLGAPLGISVGGDDMMVGDSVVGDVDGSILGALVGNPDGGASQFSQKLNSFPWHTISAMNSSF